MAGSESFQAGMITNPVTHILETHYRSDITPTCRLVWGSRTLEIMSVEDIYSKRRKMQIIARELVQ
jgi:SPP1 family predicted phage head-tail adaptor